MAETVFVRGAGGALWEMDVPTDGFALERWHYQLDKGELTIIPAAEWVTVGDGIRVLREVTADQPAAPPAEDAAGDDQADAAEDAEPVAKAKNRKG